MNYNFLKRGIKEMDLKELFTKNTIALDLSLVSKYRSSLMGIATIGIILCHAAPNGVNLPPLLKSVFGIGQLGVDVFFFLSGLGLFYSLSKPYNNVWEWYRKRYLRIIVPYLIIYAPALLLICLEEERSWWYYFYNLSTVSFWFNDGGCWFIAILVPLYLVAPLWKVLLDRLQHSVLLTVLICAILFSIGLVMMPYLSDYLNQCLFFFIGMWFGKKIMGGIILNIKQILQCCILFSTLLALYKLHPVFPLFWVIFFPILYLTCLLLDLIKSKRVNTVLSSIGSISLESYLYNVTLIVWINAFNLIPINLYRYRYVFIVFIGIGLSYIVHRISSRVLNVIN